MQQPSAQGIASLFRGNPAPLQQRIQQEQQGKPGLPPDLQKLLALNIVTNEKDAMAKQQAMDQLTKMQGPQGQPPTVMQTVQEQARQKMEAQAVQAQQQQQGLQALMQQVKSPQIPEGTPQPEAQPQGIDDLPVEFGLAGGGIVAFQEGKSVPRIQDEVPISDEERERLELELLTRIIGEEARNPPPPKRPPMEITESDITGIPGMEPSDLRARALREAAGPQPDNRALLNAAEVRGARQNATADREREKAANRPKYETSYDRMTRKNRGEMTDAERMEADARDALISQIPTGGEPTVTGGRRASGSDFERNILNTLAALPGAGAAKATTLGRQSLAGLAALFGREKSDSPSEEKLPAPAATPASTPAAKMQEQTYRRVSGDSGVRPPVSDIKALAEQKRRQQAPTPVAAAPVPAPVVATPQETLVQDSDAIKKVKARMDMDPMVEREAEQARRLKEIGAVDTSTYDRMIAELEKRKAQLEGPQDSYGRLMEYLGQIAATPRGMSSFEAGAAGAANVRSAEKARQLEQFNLSKQALEVSQKKIDAVRAFATEQYNVGKARFDQVYKEEFEAAKAIVTDEREAEKLAQENTLKRLEIASAERRNAANNATQLQAARISAASREAAGGGESKEIAAAEAAFARDPEAAALKKQLESPIFANNPAKSAVLIKRLRDIQASKYAQFGIKMEPAPGAESPSGTSLKYNPATGKIE
jgi:hypothetical protein